MITERERLKKKIEYLENRVRERLSSVLGEEVPLDLEQLFNHFLEGYYEDMPVNFYSAMGVYESMRRLNWQYLRFGYELKGVDSLPLLYCCA